MAIFARNFLKIHTFFMKYGYFSELSCDKKNLQWILISYGIYETRCVFYIPSPKARGYKTHNSFHKYRMKWKFISDPIFMYSVAQIHFYLGNEFYFSVVHSFMKDRMCKAFFKHLGNKFYLFVSPGGMNDRGSTCKFRNALRAFWNLHVDAHYEIYTWILCLSYLHEKQTSRIQSLYLYFIKIVPFWLRNIRFYTPDLSGRIMVWRGRLSVRLPVWVSVCLSVGLSAKLVNTIETEPLHLGPPNLVHILLMTRGRTLLIFKVRGQRSRSHAGHCCLTL